ncbi:LOW QUALITY PROTEIN: hypothetical protein PanWU01x14_218360 [Parasponia andersonii]|uniref:Uncharacterized protein n=1 Tax=Parasponia andersonii TaxID=3476 RepID=A0A2P5BQR1_PARAD|nr:LOW QUALITY PROTEIN: hypothetical protein PanWU01x14_218360 [Parasponia andersonii]
MNCNASLKSFKFPIYIALILIFVEIKEKIYGNVVEKERKNTRNLLVRERKREKIEESDDKSEKRRKMGKNVTDREIGSVALMVIWV